MLCLVCSTLFDIFDSIIHSVQVATPKQMSGYDTSYNTSFHVDDDVVGVGMNMSSLLRSLQIPISGQSVSGQLLTGQTDSSHLSQQQYARGSLPHYVTEAGAAMAGATVAGAAAHQSLSSSSQPAVQPRRNSFLQHITSGRRLSPPSLPSPPSFFLHHSPPPYQSHFLFPSHLLPLSSCSPSLSSLFLPIPISTLSPSLPPFPLCHCQLRIRGNANEAVESFKPKFSR